MLKDRNPYFSQDDQFVASALKAIDVLWEATGGDFSETPQSYLAYLNHTYSDGSVSMLPQLSKVDFSEDTTYEEFFSAAKALIKVNPGEWPEPEFTEQIQSSKLIHELNSDLDFSEEDWDFADGGNMSKKMELFFKKVIASVYLDGVTSVTDKNGNPPNEANNYLMAPDGKSFSGIFYDSPPDATAKKFPFKISEKSDGKWQIKY
jgi:hypothetical protein